MQIKLNSNDQKKLNLLFETKETNIAIGNMLSELCLYRPSSKIVSKLNPNGDEQYFLEYALSLLGVDLSNEENKTVIKRFLCNTIHITDYKTFNKNPYKSNILVTNCKENYYQFKYDSYPIFTFFPYQDINVIDDDFYREETTIGIAKTNYNYLSLYKNNELWMCITPNEINTMEKAIKDAHGNVVTLGLGLGYFAYMALQNKNVDKVVVIEKDKTIINLFLTYIYPLFPKNKTLEIINKDATACIKEINSCDYCFVDLWHNATDALPLYSILKPLIHIECSYWIEESIIALYRRCLITVMQESLDGMNDNDYLHAENETDEVINKIYFYTKNISFNSYNDIHNFCSKENILLLIKNIAK